MITAAASSCWLPSIQEAAQVPCITELVASQSPGLCTKRPSALPPCNHEAKPPAVCRFIEGSCAWQRNLAAPREAAEALRIWLGNWLALTVADAVS